MSTVLAVFTKAPVAGQVKTRLARDLGDAAALAAYEQLVEQALRRLAEFADDHRCSALWISEPHAVAQSWLDLLKTDPGRGNGQDKPVHVQTGADLGARMSATIAYHFAQGAQRVVLVGCDLPLLDAAYVSEAVTALQDHAVVFGPAEDGGYGLIGLRADEQHLLPVLFDQMSWGTAHVMDHSRARLRRAGVDWQELALLWDVDELADWQRWQALLQH
ncbi:MAG: TIGR04282 family arsenosugar biosynthesis glycosyltransferase [Pseudomonadota bacterium]